MIALQMLAQSGWEKLVWTLIGQLIVAAIAALVIVYVAVRLLQSAMREHDRRIAQCESTGQTLQQMVTNESAARMNCSARAAREFVAKDELLSMAGNLGREIGGVKQELHGIYTLIGEVNKAVVDEGKQMRELVSKKVAHCHERINRINENGGHNE